MGWQTCCVPSAVQHMLCYRASLSGHSAPCTDRMALKLLLTRISSREGGSCQPAQKQQQQCRMQVSDWLQHLRLPHISLVCALSLSTASGSCHFCGDVHCWCTCPLFPAAQALRAAWHSAPASKTL
jgi:hypothetical protein